MEKKKPDELEELSRLLDEFNITGHISQTASQENKELLETASFIKRAAISSHPPRHIVEATVDQVLSDLKKKPANKKRPWLYPGMLSTAAAILLVIGLNSSLLWPKQETSLVLPPPPLQSANQPAPPAASPAKEAEPVSKQEALSAPVTPAPPPNSPSSPAANTGEAKPQITAAPPVLAAKPPDNKSIQTVPDKKNTLLPTARKMTILEAQPKEALLTGAALSEKTILTPLSLPNKQPDAISTDEVTGAITQVYAQGTSDELILVQEPLPIDSQVTTVPANRPEDTVHLPAQPDQHQASIILNGQKITLKGKQSEEELTTLVQTLQP